MKKRKSAMVRSVSSSRGSESPMDTERAHRACEKCTRTKKKCDKALPACSRCTRLTTTCCYDFIYTAPATAVVDSGYLLSSKPADLAGPGSILDPVFDVSSEAIMTLLSSRNINWREATERYFETMNPWLTIVHPELFAHRVDGPDPGPGVSASAAASSVPRDPVMALLIVCMQLATQYDDEAVAAEDPRIFEDRNMIDMPAYRAAKRIIGIMRGLSAPTIELVQCTILLALFEFGHGEVLRAYVTIGDANTMALALGIRPGKYIDADKDAPVAYDDEERRCVYWSMLVLDRLIHVDCSLIHMPLQVPAPAPDDLLPTTNIGWTNQMQNRTTQRNPASVPTAVPVGPFQRNCQCAMLYTKAFSQSLESGAPDSLLDSFVELDIATRSLVEAMVLQASRWGEFFECFATCSCLLLFLYCRQLRTVDSTTIHAATSDVTALKAIAGLNFTIRIIADTTTDLNDQLARRPHLLASCSPLTPYSAYHCLMVLSNFENVIPNADARFHAIFSSLHFFAKRWNVAGQLVLRVESFLAAPESVQWCFMNE
ncbi:hypothetical protein B0J13DRAFT_307983 [Dactylonectria estremocensis]|uniref:Zn(2)-C6 fungal-type domain-containing protein n=1 Tax=Dactylonectria estremocensis TaxID=1079267 RepID=A0A9P9F0K0_9HYPO|nr:hypothetical protein B0J13DRAFT_307983 [Dactylonectria estremocensis]